jgi:signal peptidase I
MSKRSRALRYYRSYKPQSPLTKVFRTLLKLLIVLFIAYYLITAFFIRTYSVNTTSALPQLSTEDSILTSPLLFGPEVPLVDRAIPPLRPPRRGELVVCSNPRETEAGLPARIADPVVRFFTLQRVTLIGNRRAGLNPARSIMRVIGVPGDTVKMNDYTVSIKSRQGSSFINERQMIQEEYSLIIPPPAPGGNSEIPLSGSHPSITLGEGEYLLIPDNRGFAGSSSVWEPTAEHRITDKVLVRYWPQFTRF